LAQVIGNSGLDYRILMFTFYGNSQTNMHTIGNSSFSGIYGVCVRAPLSANGTCSPTPMQPMDGQRLFHYWVNVGSTDSLSLLLDNYARPGLMGTGPQGWGAQLRPEAYKAFIEITDDNQREGAGGIFGGRGVSAQQFQERLSALSPTQFGTVQNKNYVFHSIIGIAPKANPAEAYQPTEPVVAGQCNTAVNSGAVFQQLSIATGGLRFPMCDPTKYGTVFQQVGQGVVASAQVACDFAVPPPPPGQELNRIYVTYTPGNGGASTEFEQVRDAAACADKKFYVANGRVVFCPATCTAIRSDSQAKVAVRFTCEVGIN
jgi:hypothetical protein